MTVCECMDVEFEEIKKAVAKAGDDLEAVQEETEAGTVCECCLESDCDKVDLPLPDAIKKAKEQG